jgi:hypothetical protein
MWAFAPLRLLVYYAVLLGGMLVMLQVSPSLERALDHERGRYAMSLDVGLESQVEPQTTQEIVFGVTPMVVALSIILAMLISIPVAWVYGWTSRKAKYSKSFAQALVVFPIAVATVVFLVKSSLALAFSLAGIVAAVRFRSQLPEVRDALFLFIVIGIGLATGVQLLLVAMICSAAFNFAMLYVASTDFGRRPPRLQGLSLLSDADKAGSSKDSSK